MNAMRNVELALANLKKAERQLEIASSKGLDGPDWYPLSDCVTSVVETIESYGYGVKS